MPETRSQSLEELARVYLADCRFVRGLRDSTLDIYERSIAGFLTTPGLPRGLEELKREHWADWTADMRRRGMQPGGILVHQRVVRGWLKWLYQNDYTDRPLHDKLVTVRVTQDSRTRRTTSREEFRELRAAATEGHFRERDIAILEVFLATGLRRSEVAALTLADIDLDDRVVIVRKSKTGRPRASAFNERCEAALRAYLAVRGEQPGSLFGMTTWTISLLFQRLSERATKSPDNLRRGVVVHVSPHDLRRAFAARLREDGVDIGAVMTLMGHTSTAQTAQYSQVGEALNALRAYRQWDKER